MMLDLEDKVGSGGIGWYYFQIIQIVSTHLSLVHYTLSDPRTLSFILKLIDVIFITL